MFYSEKSGFYKYFADVIDYLLGHSNIVIHYITSDPQDQVFALAEKQQRIKPYYIGEKRLITLMMKMDADMVVMTMPDLDNFHIKRSYVRKDIEYVYMVHYGVGSSNLLLRPHALAHYDTILCAGQQQLDELREEEQVYGMQPRNLVLCGYGLLDRVLAAYEAMPRVAHDRPQILVAPSWQNGNILDSCIHPLLNSLLCGKYSVIVRPHPEYCKRYPQRLAELETACRGRLDENFMIQTDFSSNATVFQSDLVITDWSTICYEFSFATKRPTLFVDTPMKVMNPSYQDLKTVPMDISIRSEIGQSVRPEEVSEIEKTVRMLLENQETYQKKIAAAMEQSLSHVGESGTIGGTYILQALKKRQQGE